jgi:hypothetical protein
MLLIYTHKITPRFTYVFKQIFTRILHIPISFTTKIEDFIAHDSLKLTYTKQPLQSEFFIRNNELLFEQGIGDLDINIQQWDDVPCFFATNSDKSAIPFDIFAASFYLLSRYEEYIPHVKDEHGRYPYKESIAFINNFLERPLIDIWAYKFLTILQQRFPDLQAGNSTFSFTPIINVPQAFAYSNLGIMRTISGSLGDLARLRLRKIWQRYMVLLRIEKDPYHTFQDYIDLNEEYDIKAIYFFLFAKYSSFDNNISVYSTRFRSLIKSVSDYSITSLLVSYSAFSSQETLKKERKRLTDLIHRPVIRVRQHYNRLSFPDTYRNLLDAEIKEDYTMGYHDQIGFRASTCTPFYFYDIGIEMQTPLKVFSVVATDGTLNTIGSKADISKKILQLGNEIQKLNGSLLLVFHNYTLSTKDPIWSAWREIYINILKAYGSERTSN